MKNHFPLLVVKFFWLKCLVLHLCFGIFFLFKKYFFHKTLLYLVEQMKQDYVLPKLTNFISATTSFDLWMSMGHVIYLLLLFNFVGFDWQPKQMIINLFEATKTTNQTLVINLT